MGNSKSNLPFSSFRGKFACFQNYERHFDWFVNIDNVLVINSELIEAMFYSMKLLFVVFLAKLFEVRIRFINILYPNKEINYLIKVNVSVLVVGLIVAIFNFMSFAIRITI